MLNEGMYEIKKMESKRDRSLGPVPGVRSPRMDIRVPSVMHAAITECLPGSEAWFKQVSTLLIN